MNPEIFPSFPVPENLEQLRLDSLQPPVPSMLATPSSQGLPIPEPLAQLEASILAGTAPAPIPLGQLSPGMSEAPKPTPLEVLQTLNHQAFEQELPVPKPLSQLATDTMSATPPTPIPLQQISAGVVQAPVPLSLEELEALVRIAG